MWETLHDISMPRPKSGTILRARTPSGQSVSLKSLAEHLGLSQAAVSLVINRAPGAKSIPQRTQELIRKAARELNYRPNHLARSRSEEHTSELQSLTNLVCRLLLEKKKKKNK